MGRILAFPNVAPITPAEIELVPGIVSHRPEGGPGAMQTIDRGTDYWRIRMRFEHLCNEERAAVERWHAGTRAGALPFFVDLDRAYCFSGTLPNTTVVPQSSLWSVNSNADLTTRVQLGHLAVTRRGGVSTYPLFPSSDGSNAFSSPVSPYGTYAFRVDHTVANTATSSLGLSMQANAAVHTVPAGRTWLAVNTRYVESFTFAPDVTSSALSVGFLPQGFPGETRIGANFFVHRAPVVDNGENLLSNNVIISSATLLGSGAVISDATLNHSWFPGIEGGSRGAARYVESVNSAQHGMQWVFPKTVGELQTWWVRGRVRRGDGALIRSLRVAFYNAAGAASAYYGVSSANALFTETGGFSETTGWLADLRGGAETSGWLEFGLRTRTNSLNELRFYFAPTTGGGASTSGIPDAYDGDGSSNIGIDGFTIGRALAYENYRTDYGRIVQTSGNAVTSGSPQPHGTSYLYFKGAPSSQQQLAGARSFFTVGHELHRLTADAMTDAAGTGVIEFEPPLRNPSVHHAPICFFRPYSLFRCARPPKIVEEFGVYISLDVELEEVFT